MRFTKKIGQRTSFHLVVAVYLVIGVVPSVPGAFATEPVNPLLKEFSIKVDPTALNPPTSWHVPGVTPMIWTMDPANPRAYRTTEAREVKLKPGEYRFGTYTFDFAFTVNLTGTLEFAKALDHCVKGRGTQELIIKCSHTQPYPQEPDYYDSKN